VTSIVVKTIKRFNLRSIGIIVANIWDSVIKKLPIAASFILFKHIITVKYVADGRANIRYGEYRRTEADKLGLLKSFAIAGDKKYILILEINPIANKVNKVCTITPRFLSISVRGKK